MPVVLSDQRSVLAQAVLAQEKKEFRMAQELGVPVARSRAAATASKAECWFSSDKVVWPADP
jgi:hypothetical protein